jgi:hypothetical protein
MAAPGTVPGEEILALRALPSDFLLHQPFLNPFLPDSLHVGLVFLQMWQDGLRLLTVPQHTTRVFVALYAVLHLFAPGTFPDFTGSTVDEQRIGFASFTVNRTGLCGNITAHAGVIFPDGFFIPKGSQFALSAGFVCLQDIASFAVDAAIGIANVAYHPSPPPT